MITMKKAKKRKMGKITMKKAKKRKMGKIKSVSDTIEINSISCRT